MNHDFQDKTQLANYLVRKFGNDGVSIIKAIKMIFLADVYALRTYGTMVSNDEYYALKNGPIASEIDDILEQDNNLNEEELQYIKSFLERDGKKTTWDTITSIQEVDEECLCDLEKKVIDTIYEKYKDYSEQELIDLTHQYYVWKEHEQNLKNGSKREKIDMRGVFKNDGDLSVPQEVLEGSKFMYG